MWNIPITAMAALLYGGIMSVLVYDFDGIIQIMLWTVFMAAIWGFPFYFVMRAISKMSEKNVDKILREAEKSDADEEESQNEVS